MNQYLVDYTVRNITTGDEEDIRVLELTDEEIADFPEAVREEVRDLIRQQSYTNADGVTTGRIQTSWAVDQEHIRVLLLPYITDRALYDGDYAAWETNVLEGAYEGIDALSGTDDKGYERTPSGVVLCLQCASRPATFTVDTPGDGVDVCSLCLGDTVRELAESGHAWENLFPGQYPYYVKVTPRVVQP